MPSNKNILLGKVHFDLKALCSSCTQNVRSISQIQSLEVMGSPRVQWLMGSSGGAGRARTDDPRIMSPML